MCQNLQHAVTFRVQTMSDDRNVKGIMIKVGIYSQMEIFNLYSCQ